MSNKSKFPVLPLRDVIVFPNMVIPLFVGRSKSIAALDAAMEDNKQIFLVAQKNADNDNPSQKDVYKNGTDNVKQKEFNSLLASVAEIAFVNPSESFKKYDYDTELKILTQTMMDYLELSDQSKKVDGD